MDLDDLGAVWDLIVAQIRANGSYPLDHLRQMADEELQRLTARGSIPFVGPDRLFALATEALEFAGIATTVNGELRHNVFHAYPPVTAGSSNEAEPVRVTVDYLRRNERFDGWLKSTMTKLNDASWTPGEYQDFIGFQRLEINGPWRQFANVEIDFHRRLTVLTGANASGKTTLLGLLAKHFLWNLPLLAVPRSENYYADFADEKLSAWTETSRQVGSIHYSFGSSSPIYATSAPTPMINVAPSTPQAIRGLFLPSHRSSYMYSPLQKIPASFPSRQELLTTYSQHAREMMTGSGIGGTSAWMMKEALFAAVMYGSGNEQLKPSREATETWAGFQDVLRKVLPSDFKFEGLTVEPPDLLVLAGGHRFLLEALSGGLGVIFDLCWQIFLMSNAGEDFTVCIDEPENHLHPGLQRTLLPGLLAAFPRMSFVVATHSPFIITSVQDSHVYSLLPGENGIESTLIDKVSMASTPDRVLMQILGLDSTLPQWAESALDDALAAVPADPSVDDLRHLRITLTDLGMKEQFPAAVEALSKDDNAQD